MKGVTPLRIAFGALAAAMVLTGCINPEDYKTTPVTVQTPKGEVVCQLYTDERVLWDEAVSAPAGMSISEADEICKAEGKRRL